MKANGELYKKNFSPRYFLQHVAGYALRNPPAASLYAGVRNKRLVFLQVLY